MDSCNQVTDAPEEERRRLAIDAAKPRVRQRWNKSSDLCTYFMSDEVVAALMGISSAAEAPPVDENTLDNRWKSATEARLVRRVVDPLSSTNLTIEDASTWRNLNPHPSVSPLSKIPPSTSTTEDSSKKSSSPQKSIEPTSEKMQSTSPLDLPQNAAATNKEIKDPGKPPSNLNGPSSAVIDLVEETASDASLKRSEPLTSSLPPKRGALFRNSKRKPQKSRSNRKKRVAAKSILSGTTAEAHRLDPVVAPSDDRNRKRRPTRWELEGMPTRNFSKRELKNMPVLYARRFLPSDQEDKTFRRA